LLFWENQYIRSFNIIKNRNEENSNATFDVKQIPGKLSFYR